MHTFTTTAIRPDTPLYAFSQIPLGEFELCKDFFETHRTVDFRKSAIIVWWQLRKTFDRLLNVQSDTEDADQKKRLIREYALRCVQEYALLSYGADCGWENLVKYLGQLIVMSGFYRESYRKEYRSRIHQAANERLEFLDRPVSPHAYRLKVYYILIDYLYDKAESDVRQQLRGTIIERVQDELEKHVSRRMTVPQMTFVGKGC